jgi:hypothetical protein
LHFLVTIETRQMMDSAIGHKRTEAHQSCEIVGFVTRSHGCDYLGSRID